MSLLLDTHVLLWWLTDDERLPDRLRTAVANGDAEVHVSAASAWEATTKSAVGELTLPERWWEHVREQGFTELPVTVEDVSSQVPCPATTTTRSTGCSSRRRPGAA